MCIWKSLDCDNIHCYMSMIYDNLQICLRILLSTRCRVSYSLPFNSQHLCSLSHPRVPLQIFHNYFSIFLTKTHENGGVIFRHMANWFPPEFQCYMPFPHSSSVIFRHMVKGQCAFPGQSLDLTEPLHLETFNFHLDQSITGSMTS